MRSLFFTPKPEDVPEEPVNDRQPEENRANDSPDKHIKARRTKNVHFDRRVKSELHLEECCPGILRKGQLITVSVMGTLTALLIFV